MGNVVPESTLNKFANVLVRHSLYHAVQASRALFAVPVLADVAGNKRGLDEVGLPERGKRRILELTILFGVGLSLAAGNGSKYVENAMDV